jgi:hypothetical protein
MPRRVLVSLSLVFLVTRLISISFAASPERYEVGGINPASDVSLYEGWAREMVDNHNGAYTEVRIEYPPGSLPFFLLPKVVGTSFDYLPKFITLMLLLDIAGLVGLLILSRRWGSSWGPWLWVILIAALGPVVYLRLDLIPAVATIWAIERASARDWFSSGGWIGFGIVTKLYPALFVLPGLLASRRNWRFPLGVAMLVILPLVPLIPALDALRESVLGYHTQRGIQVESLWGSILFVVMKAGGELSVDYTFGALHFAGPTADALKPLSTIVSALTVLGASLLALRPDEERGSDRTFAEVSFTVLALALAFGSVFSPQFLVWLFAVGACIACDRFSRLGTPVLLLIPVAFLTHAIFPFLYNRMLAAETGALAVLWIRNLLIVAIAAMSVWSLLPSQRDSDQDAGVSDPSTPALASG